MQCEEIECPIPWQKVSLICTPCECVISFHMYSIADNNTGCVHVSGEYIVTGETLAYLTHEVGELLHEKQKVRPSRAKTFL